MVRRLLSPRWIVASLFVIALAVLFVLLGFWQLQRHGERQTENDDGLMRFSEGVMDLDATVDLSAAEDLEYRRLRLTGVFDPSHEVLIRSQVYRGTAGFHLITPLVTNTGAVLVNRGWVSLDLDSVPVLGLPPPAGQVVVTGWGQLSQQRPPLGPEDPSGETLAVLSRVDIDRIAEQVPYGLAPIYLVEIGEDRESLPVPVELPAFDGDGPHLAYAIQWFAFAAIGIIGYGFLLRRRLGQSK